MNRTTTAAVRTPAGYTTPFEVEAGVRQRVVAGPFLFNFVVEDMMQGTVKQCPADVISQPPARLLVDLEYADDVL
ncbi:hypothetical protein RB195_025496 [Necator americanus]|uniref:Reverse transcriptase domain-containing protein n=1 Tax=Necator americanus TaxID=51031 RepID=A0ABR1ESM3_NECAM